VLGRINPDNFLGGRTKLDQARAARAIAEKLAKRLDMSVDEAALGALRILTHSMVQAIEVNSVRRGYDPRDFALVAFGGAGPLFACDIARELAIPHVVVPAWPGLTSAMGLLTSHITYDFSRTLMMPLDKADPAYLAECIHALEARARAQLECDGFAADAITFVRSADCRYAGQGYELRTPASAGAIDGSFIADLVEAFHAAHRRQYGVDMPAKAVQLVNARVVGIGRIPKLNPSRIATGGAAADVASRRAVVFEVGGRPRRFETAIYDRASLKSGNVIMGPAIVEQMDSTTVIPPGRSAAVDSFGNLVITLREDAP
jgi:N-methylhydantoinase A/oxoprolinase/acetone carboxylase beta subunit